MDFVPPMLQKTLQKTEYWGEVQAANIPSKSHKCVAVEGDCAFDKNKPRAEVEYFESLNQVHDAPLVGGIVAYLPMEEGPNVVGPFLKAMAKRRMVKGIRRMFQYEASNPDFILQPKMVESIKLLAEYDLSFDVCVVQEQLSQVTQLAEACPKVSFVLDHLGKPAIKNSPSGTVNKEWATGIIELAECSNVHAVKISGLITEANLDSWTRRDIEPYICHVVKTFGVDRCIFGSDWPILKLAGDYQRWVTVLTNVLLDNNLYTVDNIDMFFSGNAERVYRL